MRLKIRVNLITILIFGLIGLAAIDAPAQTPAARIISGVVVSDKNESVAGASVTASHFWGSETAVTDSNGSFSLTAPVGVVTLRIEGKNLNPLETNIGANESTSELRIKVTFIVPQVHESIVITASALDPSIDRRDDAVYKGTLFSRDDQIFDTLAAGINAGQHEGGGKSLEIRRFGFNLDHGGVNGGIKVLVDDVQQNQGTQGHGQGYLGGLKNLTPELVDDVDILNGPFSAEYGDFSGLGVVQIRLKESLPDQLTMRFQGGSFNNRRAFLAYSPELKNAAAFIAYEPSFTDGPFLNPGRYRRDNVTGNYTYHLSDSEALGFKLNLGRNRFFSSGEIPLDLVD